MSSERKLLVEHLWFAAASAQIHPFLGHDLGRLGRLEVPNVLPNVTNALSSESLEEYVWETSSGGSP